jgi:CDP-glucose 4,6-dehydratase
VDAGSALEKMVIHPQFWRGKRVFLTGHTGFKGAWLSVWLHQMGAQVYGYSLPSPTNPSLYAAANVSALLCQETIADIRDLPTMTAALDQAKPDIVFHLAAQAIVLDSYKDPIETFSSNVMGTVTLLQAVRSVETVRAVIAVTSDKCYENREWVWGYRETDPMGGYDPYSASKGATELAVASMRQSFFHPDDYARHGVAVASVRAGNVIGGGDWARHRLIPDMMRSLMANEPCIIRNPGAIRPWQHVLEPLSGYLCLAERLCGPQAPNLADGWNFGPRDGSARPVSWIADELVRLWPNAPAWIRAGEPGLHENIYLKLDMSKAQSLLGWSPVWDLSATLDSIVQWYLNYRQDANIADHTRSQIDLFCRDMNKNQAHFHG